MTRFQNPELPVSRIDNKDEAHNCKGERRIKKPFQTVLTAVVFLYLLFDLGADLVARDFLLNKLPQLAQSSFKPGNPGYTHEERPLVVSHCVEEGDWISFAPAGSPDYLVSKASLDLPFSFSAELSSGMLGFVSSGDEGGSFNILTSPDQPQDKITLNVIIEQSEYSDEGTRCTQICTSSNHAFKVFSLRTRVFQECTRFQSLAATIVFPESNVPSGDPLHIQDFRASLSNTDIHVGNIGAKVSFDYISLKSYTASPINVTSLSGDSIEIRSFGGTIRGTFNATSSLRLITQDAPIMVNVSLNDTSSIAEGRYSHPSLTARTSNSPINATINLFGRDLRTSPYDDLKQFWVDANTTNGPVTLRFNTAPADSFLQVFAVTSESPVEVLAHSTYQGYFNLTTSDNQEATLKIRKDIADPSGEDKPRHFDYTNIENGLTAGKVYWGDEIMPKYPGMPHAQDGSIQLCTVNSSVLLVL